MIPITKLPPDFSGAEVEKLLNRADFENEEVAQVAAEIIKSVRRDGDKALVNYTRRFDKAELSVSELKVTEAEIEKAYREVGKSFVEAIRLAKRRISFYHQRQKMASWFTEERSGLKLGQIIRPLKRVGLYVPGGRAAYPSTVLMGAIPAQIAGVKEIAMCVPPDQSGQVNPYSLAAAGEVGLKEIYRVGGAQAIAALAYGTETVKAVDKIVGPGNIYVTLAKKMVVGRVDIDMLAGPSEVVVLADEKANPLFVAVDMIAQAEHAPDAIAVLITSSDDLAKKVKVALGKELKKLARREVAQKSLEENGRIFLVSSLSEGMRLVNLIAPEHLEIMTTDPEALMDRVENAGAIFLGSYSPEGVGDYVAGPNHILPTGGTARFSSPLGTDDFVKKTSVISFDRKGLESVASAATNIAKAEGLEGHGRSVWIRVEKDEGS